MTTTGGDLQDALAAAMGRASGDAADLWAGRGWTAPMVTRLATLSDWAMAHGGHLARNGRMEGFHLLAGLCQSAAAPTDEIAPGLYPVSTPELDLIWPWLALLAAARDAEGMRAAYALALGREGVDAAAVGWRALGDVGALGFSAGLTLAEAQRLTGAQADQVAELVLLAGLRGYVLPEAFTAPLVNSTVQPVAPAHKPDVSDQKGTVTS